MSSRFFTVAIPTKNRPERVSDAVASVVRQTFTDVEIVVCDNSDEPEAVRTEAAVREFDDPRIRYVRTNGRLSMADNWERAIADARGEYVGILTDRSVFRGDALEIVRREIESSDAPLVSWFSDRYGSDPLGRVLKRRPCTFKRHRLSRESILSFFLDGAPKFAPKILPKLMTCVCRRSILDAIRDSTGRCCLPVAPDYTSGFLMLSQCDWVLLLDEALYVSVGTGNGADFRRGGELADRFRRDLGMTWEDMVDRMPSRACFSHAVILNDFLRVRALVPDRLGGFDLNKVQYYVGCMNDYAKTARHGVFRNKELALLHDALDAESPEVQRDVRATRLYASTTATFAATERGGVAVREARRVARRLGRSALRQEVGKVKRVVRRAIHRSPAGFDTVFEALAWDRAHPREPAAQSFLDVLPGVGDPAKPTARGGGGQSVRRDGAVVGTGS